MDKEPTGKTQERINYKSGKTNLLKKSLVKILNVIAKERLQENEKIPTAFWIDILLNIIVIVFLVYVIRTYIISPFQVFGPSMCDTMNNIDSKCQRGYGEYIIINKIGYINIFGWHMDEPRRGDIVVFHPPYNKTEYFIKRIIGLPGETVKLEQGGIIIVNKDFPAGFKLKEEYLNTENHDNTHPYKDDMMVFAVPENHYFVLGDNRIASSDSRSCFRENFMDNKCGKDPLAPYLPKGNLEGKAWLILWPISKLSSIQDPNYR